MTPKNALSQNKYPIKSYSWLVLSDVVCIKFIDPTAITDSESVVPIEIREYFGVENMKLGENKKLTLCYGKIKSSASIHMYENPPSSLKTVIGWKSPLAEIIKKKFDVCIEKHKHKKDSSIIRFEKIRDDLYHIGLIYAVEAQKDAENESKEFACEVNELKRLEGNIKQYFAIGPERNTKNRQDAILFHGTKCSICNFDFEQFYGEHGSGFIEIHHITPLQTGNERPVDPQTDLIPVCSNCHRMIHRRRENYLTPEMLKEMISTARKYNSTE